MPASVFSFGQLFPSNLRLQGIALALGELARTHREPDLALMVLAGLDLTVDELKEAGADAYDVAALNQK